jgi:hypothetical protein
MISLYPTKAQYEHAKKVLLSGGSTERVIRIAWQTIRNAKKNGLALN